MIDLGVTVIYKRRKSKMSTGFQRVCVQLFIALLLLISRPMPARASEPITVLYGRGRAWLMDLTITGQNQLEKGDLDAAQRSLDTVIKADPTFYPAYYVRARVFLSRGKFQQVIQDCSEVVAEGFHFCRSCLASGQGKLLPRPLSREFKRN